MPNKKKTKVRDLKPNKDAKGGRNSRAQGGGNWGGGPVHVQGAGGPRQGN
jgi:hypothetical protein